MGDNISNVKTKDFGSFNIDILPNADNELVDTYYLMPKSI